MNKVVKEIIIKTKRRLFGANLGNNISIFQGNGLDFSEIKEYSFGDDVKKINWKITAKEQKPYINVFNEERELNIVVAFMVSGNIYFGTVRQKQEVMAEVATIIGYSAIKNSDRFSTIFFTNEANEIFEPTKSINSVYSMLEFAIEQDVIGKSVDYNNLSNYLLSSLKQKSIIFIVGDFYEEIDFGLLGAKHELYCIIVRDKFEEEPKLLEDMQIKDLNSLKNYNLQLSKTALNEYKDIIKKHDKKLKEHFLKNAISSVKIYTDEDPYTQLASLFGGRR